MFNVSTFSAIAALSFLFNVVVVRASHVLHDISGFICHCLMSVVQVDIITDSHHWSPSTIGGFLLALCLPIVDTQVCYPETVDLDSGYLEHLLPSSLLSIHLGESSTSTICALSVQVSLKMAPESPSLWVCQVRTDKEQAPPTQIMGQENSQSRGEGTEDCSTGGAALWLRTTVHEIKVAELLARYEDLVSPFYSLLDFCVSMIGGLLDLVKFVWYSWLCSFEDVVR
ncbi:hypothetical protein BCR33DRAFT_788974 [Rhizoclosmatium globosum]|uniref:Uncharacterized protein n=1 Tax=Rhizoclosmatium globosum TaxID=329046 RepID=A0A1Y2BUH5_9FUNG|nr:hypothetical protein BCR33DRAFT_788974 [Rhizoclosmatium globosum]|eukprot:ORY38396.1 hypothetical protein BCR33DRAFT_788974 [Rhizoclosmatium globosum]